MLCAFWYKGHHCKCPYCWYKGRLCCIEDIDERVSDGTTIYCLDNGETTETLDLLDADDWKFIVDNRNKNL